MGTVTEIYDYLRLLYARAGEPRCPEHDVALAAQAVSDMVDHLLELPEDSKVMILAPIVRERKGEHLHVFNDLRARGFIRVRVNGVVTDLDDVPELDKKLKHSIEAVVDRLKTRPDQRARMAESLETALELAGGIAIAESMDQQFEPMLFSNKFACSHCGYSLSELEPRLVSFNNPAGACTECDGLGVHQFFDPSRIIVDEDLTLAQGAIKGWDRRTTTISPAQRVADCFGFDTDTPGAT